MRPVQPNRRSRRRRVLLNPPLTIAIYGSVNLRRGCAVKAVVTMSRGVQQGRRGKAARALLLATAALAFPCPGAPAWAQDAELRGFLSDPAIGQSRPGDVLQPPTGQAPAAGDDAAALQAGAVAPYQPFSTGAMPDTEQAAAGGTAPARPGSSSDTPSPDAAAPPSRPRKPATGRALPGKPDADLAARDKDEQDPTNPRKSTVDAAEKMDTTEEERADLRVERTGAIERRDRSEEENPFEATGIRVGSFVLRPAIEQGITATSNADSSVGGRPAVLSETALRFNAASDWEGNSATVSGYGVIRRTLSGQEVKDAQGRVEGALDLDLGHDWSAVAKLGYEAAPETADSPVAIEGTASQPLRQTLDGSLGIRKEIGKVRLGLTGAATHDAYGDADLSSGGVLSQKDRDSTLYTATLRGGYEISPALTPFGEVEIGRRVFDQRIDASGYERSSNRIGARAGLALDLGEKLGGEVSAGWIRESFDDGRLAPISGATVAADLRWSPERDTVIGLRGGTTLEDTTNAGESGSILYDARLTAERRIRADLTANAVLGAGWRDYLGSGGRDLIYSAEAGLTWWLDRHAGITGRARHETLTSSLPDRDSRTNSLYLGLILQR